MNIQIKKLQKSRVKLTIELEKDEVRPYLEGAARDLSKDHPLKGFRPGAVPFDIMRSAVGDAALAEQALRKLVPKTYVEAVMDRQDIEAIGRPEVEAKKVTIGEPWVYEATVAVLPSVTLGDYKMLKGQRRTIEVPEEDIDRELETLRKMRASYLAVVRPVATGDRVEVDIATSIDRVPLEQGSGRKQPLIVGEGHLVPGFEDQLIGMKEGETKSFSLNIPDGHHDHSLRGKTIDFTVKVGSVQQRVLPVLDGTFARGLGEFPTVDDLKAKIRENMRVEKEEKEVHRYQMELLQQIIERTTYGEFPDVLIEGEVDKMLAELTDGLVASGLTLDQYLLQIQKTLEQIREGFHPQALERIRAGLALRAIAKAENVDVTDEELTEEMNLALRRFPSVEEAKKHVDVEELGNIAAGVIRNRKVFGRLETFAKPL